MKKHRIIFSTVALLATGIALSATNTTANAHSRAVTVPASLRGTWYHYENGYYSKIRATKYHFKITGNNGTSSYSGVKFPSYASGRADMYVHRTPKGYYNIGKTGTDDVGTYKRVTHKGHAAIKQPWHEIPDTGTYVDYWYKSKTIAKNPTESGKVHKSHFKVAKYSGFVSGAYRTGYLSDSETNYKFYKYDSELEGPGTKVAFKISNSLTPIKAKKSNTAGLLDVKYNGINAVEDDDSDYHTVLPYNTDKLDGSTVTSHTTPYSGKAVLKHGTNSKKIKTWMTDQPGNKSAFYKRVKGGWKYNGTV